MRKQISQSFQLILKSITVCIDIINEVLQVLSIFQNFFEQPNRVYVAHTAVVQSKGHH